MRFAELVHTKVGIHKKKKIDTERNASYGKLPHATIDHNWLRFSKWGGLLGSLKVLYFLSNTSRQYMLLFCRLIRCHSFFKRNIR